MEVHAHTHTPRKKWTHYFWEFLMLFLAVFCGFFAEYQLEHKIEKERGKKYIRSYVEDIRSDRRQILALVARYDSTIQKTLQLKAALAGTDIKTQSAPAYRRWKEVAGLPVFVPNYATILQLKNSGGLRLIENKEVVEQIMYYDRLSGLIKIHQQTMNEMLINRGKLYELFDITKLETDTLREKIPLLSDNRGLLSWAYGYNSDWMEQMKILRLMANTLQSQGDHLENLIKKHYKIP